MERRKEEMDEMMSVVFDAATSDAKPGKEKRGKGNT
jgi:hypothetical protein